MRLCAPAPQHRAGHPHWRWRRAKKRFRCAHQLQRPHPVRTHRSHSPGRARIDKCQSPTGASWGGRCRPPPHLGSGTTGPCPSRPQQPMRSITMCHRQAAAALHRPAEKARLAPGGPEFEGSMRARQDRPVERVGDRMLCSADSARSRCGSRIGRNPGAWRFSAQSTSWSCRACSSRAGRPCASRSRRAALGVTGRPRSHQ